MRLSRLKFNAITKYHFPKDIPFKINQGRCFAWAYIAYCTFPNVQLCSTDIHAFIKYRGKFYDAERLTGVKDWKELPAAYKGKHPFYDSPLELRFHSKESFKKAWSGQPARFSLSWRGLELKAKIRK